jgi:FixJ family two-component response regulator
MIRIAVVDDDAGCRNGIGRVLSGAGYEPVLFASAEALLAEGVNGAACLVLDVQLPGLSGFQLHAALVTAGASVPVIFITGGDEAGSRERAKRAGAVAFLSKPFLAGPLLEAIERAIDRTGSALPGL